MRRERENSIIYAYPKTHEFLRAAVEDGAVIRTLRDMKEKSPPEDVPRNMNIVGIYFASPATYENIATIYPNFGSRQRVGQIVRRSIIALWNNCSQEIQECFPLDEIKIRKPLGRRSRERISRTGGGLTYRVAELLEEGVAFEEIKKKLDLSQCDVDRLRRRLRKRGFWEEFPYVITPPAKNKKLARMLQEASSDSEIQEILDYIKIGFYRYCLRNKNLILTPVSKIADASNFRSRLRKTPFLAERLIEAGVPVGHIQKTIKSGRQKGKQNYYFIISRHLERAQKVLSGFLL